MGLRSTYSTLRRGFAESRTEEYTRTGWVVDLADLWEGEGGL